MENKDLSYWKNYQRAMEWMKGNTVENLPESTTVVDEELEFAIDDELLDFYRHSREHKINRSIDFKRRKIGEFFSSL